MRRSPGFARKAVATLALSLTLLPTGLLAQGTPAQTPAQTQPAGAESAGPQVGAAAPTFALKDQNDKLHKLSDYKGKTVVLAFYPKDDTPGCTAQMCALRDAMPQLKAKGVVVLGISVQDTASKKAFAAKYKLNFPVLADTDTSVAKAYGVLGASGVAERITFVIGPDGTLQHVDRATRLARQDGKLLSDHATALALMLSSDWKVELGKPVPSFTLSNYDGTRVTSTSNKHDLTVLVFVSTKCSFSNDYNARLVKFAADYATRGTKHVRVIGINANADERVDAIARHASEKGLTYPIVRDEGNRIADRFQAQKTPEVWVIDQRGVVRYHGAIDDHFDETQVKVNYLASAVNALLEGKEPGVKDTPPQGCSIKRERRRA